MLGFLKRAGYGFAILALLALFLLLMESASLISLGKNLGYLFVALLVVWLVIVIANRTGITGRFFTLHDWLDDIGRKDAAGNPVADPNANAKAWVIVGILLAGAIVVAPFVG